jgi:hypothetical protein
MPPASRARSADQRISNGSKKEVPVQTLLPQMMTKATEKLEPRITGDLKARVARVKEEKVQEVRAQVARAQTAK